MTLLLNFLSHARHALMYVGTKQLELASLARQKQTTNQVDVASFEPVWVALEG